MRVAILGTRGIPNNYGGFEQLAQYLSEYLVSQQHKVWVFNSSAHPYKEKLWKGVHIAHCYDPEKTIGTAGQFIYDLNCIMQIRKLKPDIVLQLGYTSSSIWHWLLPSQSVLITNMDGLEWKRSKYPALVKRFLKFAEKLAAKSSDVLIADSPGIKDYLTETFHCNPAYIAYGATPFTNPDENMVKQQQFAPFSYYLVLARFEPENNIETIIKGFSLSKTDKKLVLIGNHQNKYGIKIKALYGHFKNIIFHDAIYDIHVLNNLRYYSAMYFHGHSVGGTNPSLLEAMASQAIICAHSNVFNRHPLGDEAWYFNNANDIMQIIAGNPTPEQHRDWREKNLEKIKNQYSWPQINLQYEQLMLSSL